MKAITICTTVRGRILLACIGIVNLALIASGAANYYVAHTNFKEVTAQNLRAILRRHIAGIDDWVTTKTQMVNSLEEVALNNDASSIYSLVSRAGGFAKIYSGYPDRKFQFSDSKGVPPTFDPTVRPWYILARERQRPVVTSPFISVSTGKLVVAFAAPVYRDGNLKAVVAGDMDLDSVISNVKTVKPSQSSFGFLVDAGGKILAHPNDKLTLKPVTDLSPEFTSQFVDSLANSDAVRRVVIGDRPMLIYGQRIEHTSWSFIIALDEEEATSMIRSLLLNTVSVILVIAVLSAVVMSTLTGSVFKRLSGIRDAIDEIASGSADFTKRVPIQGNDEVAQIGQSFNAFASTLTRIMLDVRDASKSVSLATNEISVGNLDLSRRTEAQAIALGQSTTHIDELSWNIRNNASSARQAEVLAHEATEVATRGGSVIQHVVKTMGEIDSSSHRMNEIITTIEGIAFQTNILALNAAVEAARAGEFGRGFAVVANEVRGLAHHCTSAAREIKDLIVASSIAVDKGASLVIEAGQNVNDIIDAVTRVTAIINDIVMASKQQNRSIELVDSTIHHFNEVTQQNASLVEQSAAASSALGNQARSLNDLVSAFTLPSAI